MTTDGDWRHGLADDSDADAIAIIGLACRFPGAADSAEFWNNLAGGVESSQPNQFQTAAIHEEAEYFDARVFGISGHEVRALGSQQRLFLELAYTALEDGAYDPFRYDGDIGVFSGSNKYGWNVPAFTSYQLHLRGPSVNVDTACSSSLVALHFACAALRNGECDMALSGGVTVQSPHGSHSPAAGRQSSPRDIHFRAFDAPADGAVPGCGGAVVLLKRLTDALADGDHVRAVILGSAVNHDGATKSGLTEPRHKGRAAVIARALTAARVDPRTISYVEADGSGTLLGDYVEVDALSTAFRQYSLDTGWCAFGTVKTDIGHLGAASGIAGLAKTVLALEHGFIPASVNYETPNPRIDFEGGPFYVNTALARWQSPGTARRAAVNAFGAGGTNAHVVLEAPRPATCERQGDDQSAYLLMLSASTPGALDSAARQLSAHLAQLSQAAEPGTRLADVAYTLRAGRPLRHERLAVTVTSLAEASSALLSAEQVITGTAPPQSPEVVLMFPGRGVRTGMATQLHLSESVVRDVIDECAEIIRGHDGVDIRDLLLAEDANAERLSRQARVAQPALFSFEYALSLFWRELGITPAAVFGHDVGEYVAATLSEVFTLSDALAVVCARGKLQDRDDPRAPIARPTLAEFRTVVADVQRRAPRVPFLSGISGDWMTSSTATAESYWVRPGRETFSFAECIAAITRTGDPLLLECGPGEELCDLAHSLPHGGQLRTVASLPHEHDTACDGSAALNSAVGRLWVSGASLDLASFGSPGCRVPLPTYPWDREYLPVDIKAAADSLDLGAQVAVTPASVSETADAVRSAGNAPENGPSLGRSSESGDNAAAGDYARPRNELEEAITRVWAEALGMDQISVTDDFFDLGGDSLIAARTMSLVRERTGVQVPMRGFFANPTVAGLAAVADKLREVAKAEGKSDNIMCEG
jgi:phthiocerol/phenolphthiocerol synthesis type-I polyketide synthase E